MDQSGLRAEGAAASAVNSPKYRYPGEAARRLLASAPPGADGMRVLRYINPATGGAVMPTLDCYAARLVKGTPTRPKRTTYNVICLVVTGEGRSTIGEQTFEWSQHDVFTNAALDLGAPRGERRRRRSLHGDGQIRIRGARPRPRGDGIAAESY